MHNDIDQDIQAALRTEIATLRRLLAERDAEILALLRETDHLAVSGGGRGAKGLGRLASWARRLRTRLASRRYAAAMIDSGLFDPEWYFNHYPDCGAPRRAAHHYLSTGTWAGNDPGPDFDTRAYYDANPDVAQAGWPALAHYVMIGRSEGRHLSPEPRA